MDQTTQLAFRALSDPTRRDIVLHLKDQNMNIAELSKRFPITRAAVNKHLLILEEGNIVHTEKRGRDRFHSLNPDGFSPIRSWISVFDEFWDDRLSLLKSTIEGTRNDK